MNDPRGWAPEGFEDPVEVGRGGFGTVYRATDPVLGRIVAVKRLDGTLDAGGRERFGREGRAMSALSSHPNVVPLYSVGIDDRGPYLVMPFLSRGSLGDRLRRGPVPWEEAVRIVVRLAGAVESAHRRGILHRDIKPDNVLISDFDEPQLADFGVARMSGEFATTDGRLTASLPYAAPELLAGGVPTVATDVYALGATLFHLISGRAPYTDEADESLWQLISRISSQPAPILDGPGVPHDLAALVSRTLATAPGDRPATVLAVAEALQAIQRNSGSPVTDVALLGADSGDPSGPGSRASAPSPEGPSPTAPAARAAPDGAAPQPPLHEASAHAAMAPTVVTPAAPMAPTVVAPAAPMAPTVVAPPSREATKGRRTVAIVASTTLVIVVLAAAALVGRNRASDAGAGAGDMTTAPVTTAATTTTAAEGDAAETTITVPEGPIVDLNQGPGSALTTAGTAVPARIEAGASGRVRFRAVDGQAMLVHVRSAGSNSPMADLSVILSTAAVPQESSSTSSSGYAEVKPDSSGAYDVIVGPFIDSFDGSITLSAVGPTLRINAPVGGPPVPVTFTTPRQLAYVWFVGKADQSVTARWQGTSADKSTKLSLLNLDGYELTSWTASDDGTSNPAVLPANGTYEIQVLMEDDVVGGGTVTVAPG